MSDLAKLHVEAAVTTMMGAKTRSELEMIKKVRKHIEQCYDGLINYHGEYLDNKIYANTLTREKEVILFDFDKEYKQACANFDLIEARQRDQLQSESESNV